MTLSGFVLFMFGLLSELAFLYEGAAPGIFPGKAGGPLIIARMLSPARQGVIILGALAGLLIGVFELLRVGSTLTYIDSPVVGFIFVLLGVFVFFAAMSANLFLPVVNEQTILIVQALVVVNALWGGGTVDWLPIALVTGVPALVCLALIVWRKAFPAWAKALLYLWYLLSLMVIPFQDGQASFFRQAQLNWVQAYAFGMLFIFLILHGLFAARFFLMVSSMLVPRNYRWIQEIMPRLFSDEQVSLRRFGLTVLLIAALLLLNQQLGLVDRATAVSLGMLLGVQVLSQRSGGLQFRRITQASAIRE